MSSHLVKIAPIEPLDPARAVSAADLAGAAFSQQQETGELTSSARFEREIDRPFDDFIRGALQGDGPAVPQDLIDDLFEQDFRPDDALLGRTIETLEGLGVEIPDGIRPDQRTARREALAAQYVERFDKRSAIMEEGTGLVGAAAPLLGQLGAGLDDIETVVSLPAGAPARLGIGMAALFEGSVNAAANAAGAPERNRFMRELGLPEESILGSMAAGFVLGGALGGGQQSLRALARYASTPKEKRKVAGAAMTSGDPGLAALGRRIKRDADDEAASVVVPTRAAVREAETRMEAAAAAAATGEPLAIPDRPIAARARQSIINGEIEEVDPTELALQPERFQFKSDIVGEGGQTAKLQNVTEWMPERAGIAVVFEGEDGVRAVADGHQRVGLANRIKAANPESEIRMAAKVYREADGFSPEDVRVIAAMKNIAEAADGMTVAMARDASKVLRLAPERIMELPAGPGIARAQQLSRLSDDAFGMYINEVVPERYAAAVGRMVDNPAMHEPIMRLLERTAPNTSQQAESIIEQAMAAPVETRRTASLFGEEEVTRSLYLERAKVLERTMAMLREDRQTFKVLDERASTIETGGNRLNRLSNKQRREALDATLDAVSRLAHRAGPISEALNDGAKKYAETGRLKDAAEAVAGAVRGEIERDGLDGLRARAGRRTPEPQVSSATAPDPNAAFAEPQGVGQQAQIADTRIDVPDRPREGFSDDAAARADLQRLIDSGAPRSEIDSHPAVTDALRAMDEAEETITAQGYDSPEWHNGRVYKFGETEITGTADALERWVEDAKSLAWRETGEEFPGLQPGGREVTIITGPPAAGKSSIANEIAKARGAAIVDGDEIKKTIPEYDNGTGAAAVHEESSDLAKLLEGAIMGDGFNVVLPKVGANEASIAAAIGRYRTAGYEVRLVNMDVTPQNAYRRMIGRFVKTGRIIPPSYVDAVGAKPSATYRALKKKGLADGYAEIDNNGSPASARPVTDQSGQNPLEGSGLDLREGRARGQADGPGALGDPGGVRAAESAAPDLTDLRDAVPLGVRAADDGEIVADARSRSEVAAELDADDEFADQLGACLK